MVGVLSTGEYVVSGIVGGGDLFVYDARGRFIRAIGGRGEGPGEFGPQTRVTVGPGDTLYVVDDFRSRLQVLTPDGGFIRSFPIPPGGRAFALLRGGHFAFDGRPLEDGDPQFFVLDREGLEKARFGSPVMELPADDAWLVSRSRDGGFWTGSVWRYALDHRRIDGSLDRSVVREVPWFPPFHGERMPEGLYTEVPPPPFLLHAWEDERGRIWTYSLVPDPDWEPTPDAAAPGSVPRGPCAVAT